MYGVLDSPEVMMFFHDGWLLFFFEQKIQDSKPNPPSITTIVLWDYKEVKPG